MILVISPAKALDYETPITVSTYTRPDFLDDSAALIEVLREKSPAEIAELMSLSDPLSTLNVARYASWSRPFSPDNARQALLAFNGDVYEGLDARSLTADELGWAQDHLRILSGLYGVLRPLDLMQAYRLEMGTKLDNMRGKDLYAFWGERITALLNADLHAGKSNVLVNLASEEYFKSVKRSQLDVPVIQPVFEDWKGDRYRVISFFAKRARGLMARYAAEHRLKDVEKLKQFDSEEYAFVSEASDEASWIFRRRLA